MNDPDLEGLLSVQDLDLAIDQHRHRRSALPEQAEIDAIDRHLTALKTEMAAATATRDEIAGRQDAAERELAATEERSKAVSKRLYGGEVSAARELQMMASDLESLKARASSLEDQILGLLDEREPIDDRLASLSGDMQVLADKREQLSSLVNLRQQEIDEEITTLQLRRREAAAVVSPALLATYEKIRPRLGGIGVARLIGNHCDGCHLVLSAVELDHVRHMPDGEVATCEQCSRILVPSSKPS